ncbi:MAG TPA: phosphotransferase [Gaiellaceae bacterium]|nr:phosphotransferase [Gaiellaceae bacterium]
MKPEAVERAERLLGTEAVSWEPVAYRGWSRNEHWTFALADGTRAFAKEASIPPTPDFVRREAEILALLEAPFAPRLLAFEDGERPLLVLEDLSPGAHWPPPWRPGDVELVLTTLAEVAETTLEGLTPFPRLLAWAEIAADPEPFLSLGVASPGWVERTAPALAEAEAHAPIDGDALVHCDVRSDNLCLRGGRAVLVDWNWARRGNPALDLAYWLPTLTLEGGPWPAEIAPDLPGGLVAMLAGFFASHAHLPPPEGAPLVRGFQLDQLRVALPWACESLGLEPPDGL